MADENIDLGGGVDDGGEQLMFSGGQDGSELTYMYHEGQETDYLAHAGDQYLVGVSAAELGAGNEAQLAGEEEPMDTGVAGSSTGKLTSSAGRVLGTVTEMKPGGGGGVKKTTVVTVPPGTVSGQVGGLTLGSSVQTVDQGDGTVTIVVTPGQGVTQTGKVSAQHQVIAPSSAQKIVILPSGATVATGTGGTVTSITGQKTTTIPMVRYITQEQAATMAASGQAVVTLGGSKTGSVVIGSGVTSSTTISGSASKKPTGKQTKETAAVKTPKLATLAKKPSSDTTPAAAGGAKMKDKPQQKGKTDDDGDDDLEDDDDDEEVAVSSKKKKGGTAMAVKIPSAGSASAGSARKSSRKSTMSSKLAEWGLLPSSSGSVLSTSDSEGDSDDVPIIKGVVRTYTKKVGGGASPGKATPTGGLTRPVTSSVSKAVGSGKSLIKRATENVKVVGREMQNKSLMCKPIMMTKATSCNPIRISKSTQTEEDFSTKGKVFVPVPVPLVIPAPMNLYNTPAPIPVPIPVPLLIPAFIPTTKSSVAAIIEQLKELHDSMPSDPLEADMLKMADIAAVSEQEAPHVPAVNPAPPNGSGGDMDMLEMAMHMTGDDNGASAMESLILGGKRTIIDTTSYGAELSSSAAKRPRLDTGAAGSDILTPGAAIRRAAVNDTAMRLKYSYGLNAWRMWVNNKNEELKAAGVKVKAGEVGGGIVGGVKQIKSEILTCSGEELSFYLSMFVREIVKPTGERYAPDSVYYLCLGIQYYLYENGRIDNIFQDVTYSRFIDALNDLLTGFQLKVNMQGQVLCRVTEEQLWESRQLGAHSPQALLNTLIYFNTKHFMLTTADAHLNLSFSNIMKQWKKNSLSSDGRAARTVYLRYNSLGAASTNPSTPQKTTDVTSYEQLENTDNPLRCPVKLYEFYLAKCPETIKHRNDMFYLVPEPSCVPQSPVWYSATPLSLDSVTRMLNRISVVKEIQETQIVQTPATYYG